MGSRIFRFLLIVSTFALYTSYMATQLWPPHPFVATALTVVLFVMMLGGTFIYRANPQVFDHAWFKILIWSGSLAMGIWATFILIVLPLDILHLLGVGALKVSHASTKFDDGSFFLPQDFYFSILALATILAGFGLIEVLRGPRVKNVAVKIANLHPALQGLKIAQLSDLHVGPTIRKNYVAEMVRRTNAVAPDLIVLTGDIADAHVASIVEHLEPLRELRARYGVFYVTGNHEYYWNAPDLIAKVQELGLQPLLNENKIIRIGDARVLVGGITDPMGHYLKPPQTPDLKKAAQSGETAQLKIVLAHRPDVSDEAEALGFDLQFSGHTHAGQFFPFSLLIGLAHKYNRGLYRHGRMWVYVNPGTGYWGPADRLGVASEITLVTISS
jgi:predicted MPP superfamily phosphohydrolase